ncbi:uncharacterized protein isoform X2 [Musca autumnalis]|uniref:uncharacterized protein isoform X2 n=1 Tax=Musca autumnalis TaxID=221902 RepID=UPI003CE79231
MDGTNKSMESNNSPDTIRIFEASSSQGGIVDIEIKRELLDEGIILEEQQLKNPNSLCVQSEIPCIEVDAIEVREPTSLGNINSDKILHTSQDNGCKEVDKQPPSILETMNHDVKVGGDDMCTSQKTMEINNDCGSALHTDTTSKCGNKQANSSGKTPQKINKKCSPFIRQTALKSVQKWKSKSRKTSASKIKSRGSTSTQILAESIHNLREIETDDEVKIYVSDELLPINPRKEPLDIHIDDGIKLIDLTSTEENKEHSATNDGICLDSDDEIEISSDSTLNDSDDEVEIISEIPTKQNGKSHSELLVETEDHNDVNSNIQIDDDLTIIDLENIEKDETNNGNSNTMMSKTIKSTTAQNKDIMNNTKTSSSSNSNNEHDADSTDISQENKDIQTIPEMSVDQILHHLYDNINSTEHNYNITSTEHNYKKITTSEEVHSDDNVCQSKETDLNETISDLSGLGGTSIENETQEKIQHGSVFPKDCSDEKLKDEESILDLSKSGEVSLVAYVKSKDLYEIPKEGDKQEQHIFPKASIANGKNPQLAKDVSATSFKIRLGSPMNIEMKKPTENGGELENGKTINSDDNILDLSTHGKVYLVEDVTPKNILQLKTLELSNDQNGVHEKSEKNTAQTKGTFVQLVSSKAEDKTSSIQTMPNVINESNVSQDGNKLLDAMPNEVEYSTTSDLVPILESYKGGNENVDVEPEFGQITDKSKLLERPFILPITETLKNEKKNDNYLNNEINGEADANHSSEEGNYLTSSLIQKEENLTIFEKEDNDLFMDTSDIMEEEKTKEEISTSQISHLTPSKDDSNIKLETGILTSCVDESKDELNDILQEEFDGVERNKVMSNNRESVVNESVSTEEESLEVVMSVKNEILSQSPKDVKIKESCKLKDNENIEGDTENLSLFVGKIKTELQDYDEYKLKDNENIEGDTANMTLSIGEIKTELQDKDDKDSTITRLKADKTTLPHKTDPQKDNSFIKASDSNRTGSEMFDVKAEDDAASSMESSTCLSADLNNNNPFKLKITSVVSISQDKYCENGEMEENQNIKGILLPLMDIKIKEEKEISESIEFVQQSISVGSISNYVKQETTDDEPKNLKLCGEIKSENIFSVMERSLLTGLDKVKTDKDLDSDIAYETNHSDEIQNLPVTEQGISFERTKLKTEEELDSKFISDHLASIQNHSAMNEDVKDVRIELEKLPIADIKDDASVDLDDSQNMYDSDNSESTALSVSTTNFQDNLLENMENATSEDTSISDSSINKKIKKKKKTSTVNDSVYFKKPPKRRKLEAKTEKQRKRNVNPTKKIDDEAPKGGSKVAKKSIAGPCKTKKSTNSKTCKSKTPTQKSGANSKKPSDQHFEEFPKPFKLENNYVDGNSKSNESSIATEVPRPMKFKCDFNTIFDLKNPCNYNVRSLQPRVRLKRLQWRGKYGQNVMSSKNVNRPKTRSLDGVRSQYNTFNQSSNQDNSSTAEVPTTSEGLNPQTSILHSIAAERAFINHHLISFGYSPIQFQLYNDPNDLKIFLKYLLNTKGGGSDHKH